MNIAELTQIETDLAALAAEEQALDVRKNQIYDLRQPLQERRATLLDEVRIRMVDAHKANPAATTFAELGAEMDKPVTKR